MFPEFGVGAVKNPGLDRVRGLLVTVVGLDMWDADFLLTFAPGGGRQQEF